MLLHAVEGWGKTSTGAFAPDPLLLMAKGETGYLTLYGAGLVPSVPCLSVEKWDQLLTALDQVAAERPCQTLVLDALAGFERLCHEWVCARDFGGDWGERGFASFQKGYWRAVQDWCGMLARLDAVHRVGITVLFLAHTQVKRFSNPLGADYDRYCPNVHEKTWGPTAQWADAVCFGNFVTVTEKDGLKTKGVGGTTRACYCERRDAYDAKNRYGMPAALEIPNDPAQAWAAVVDAMKRRSPGQPA